MTAKTVSMEFNADTGSAGDDDRSSHWNQCLARVASQRDLEAFQELFDHFAPLIKAFACKVPALQENESFAEDLVQETMLKVWNRAATFNAELASSSTWIFTIARNMRIDLLRKQARHAVNTVSLTPVSADGDELDLEDIWLEDQGAAPFDLLVKQRTRRQIRESLRTLPAEQAEILHKVYLEDKSHSEVAQELDLPLGTVKSRVRLAMNKLRLVVDR